MPKRIRFTLLDWTADPFRKVETRNGRPVRILCHDRRSPHTASPIVALVGEEQDIVCYNIQGTTGSSIQMPSDLFIVQDEPNDPETTLEILEQYTKELKEKTDRTEIAVRKFTALVQSMKRTDPQSKD